MGRLRFGERSIAVRLFVMSALWSFAILLVAGLLLTAYYRRTTEQAFDDRLGAFQRALIADIVTSGSARIETGGLGDPRFEVALSGWYWQVTRLDAEKPEVQASRSLFAASLPRLAHERIPAEEGGLRRASIIGPDDRPLRLVERVVDTEGNGIYLVQVAASVADLEAQIRRFELALAVTFALLALALVGTTAFQVRFGLRPLRQLEAGIAGIRRGETDRIEGAFPRDIAPVAAELNLLIAANREIVERARTQVGNLAHALKTPLSVIVNEAAAAEGTFAEKVGEQVRIMRDQVSYYLDRARAATRAGAVGTTTEVQPVLTALRRTFEKIYVERALTISTEAPAGLRFLGERQDFEEMVGNLFDNAGKWARSTIDIRVASRDGEAPGQKLLQVIVDDDGPGLTPAEREEATRRGRRLDETKPGSGLGLSIVSDLAAAYGGALRLETSPLGGLRAELSLPGA
ncbi:MAG: sensor histidine kinase [Methylobacteriaceae bacterium]|nr:sensor histidine kinase [Methylobacteriaceae bacterium]